MTWGFIAVAAVLRRRILIGLCLVLAVVAALVLVTMADGFGIDDAWHGQQGGAP